MILSIAKAEWSGTNLELEICYPCNQEACKLSTQSATLMLRCSHFYLYIYYKASVPLLPFCSFFHSRQQCVPSIPSGTPFSNSDFSTKTLKVEKIVNKIFIRLCASFFQTNFYN